MASTWNNLWKFETKRFVVALDWAWEDYPDLSWDETGETREKCESGEWGVYTFRIRVLLDGREIAADHLGNSIYADPVEFYREHIGIAALSRRDGRNYGCYFSDMLRQSVSDARKALIDVPRLRKAS